jgi:hypothetical protein
VDPFPGSLFLDPMIESPRGDDYRYLNQLISHPNGYAHGNQADTPRSAAQNSWKTAYKSLSFFAGTTAASIARIRPWRPTISYPSRSFALRMLESPSKPATHHTSPDIYSDEDDLSSQGTPGPSPSSIFREIEHNLHCNDISSVKFTKLVEPGSGRETWHIDKVSSAESALAIIAKPFFQHCCDISHDGACPNRQLADAVTPKTPVPATPRQACRYPAMQSC